MEAAYIEAIGEPATIKVGELPMGEPGPGEVQVKTMAAGVGPWDVKKMRGLFGELDFPQVLGSEFSGIVGSVGAGADWRNGDEVYGTSKSGNAFAEYVVTEGDRLAPKPAQLSFEEAAGLVIAAGTAYEGLVDRLRLQNGETILITGASGGVGTAAVQIAAALGARAIAVASAHNHDYVRSLGAAEVVDYAEPDWSSMVVGFIPGGVDALFDGVGGATRDEALRAVREGGRAVGIVFPPPDGPVRGITVDVFSAKIDRTRLEAVGRMVEEGKLRAEIEEVLPLDRAGEALERVASGHTRGKIVLKFE